MIDGERHKLGRGVLAERSATQTHTHTHIQYRCPSSPSSLPSSHPSSRGHPFHTPRVARRRHVTKMTHQVSLPAWPSSQTCIHNNRRVSKATLTVTECGAEDLMRRPCGNIRWWRLVAVVMRRRLFGACNVWRLQGVGCACVALLCFLLQS